MTFPLPASPDASQLALDIRGISKTFGRFPALNDVSLQARDKEFLALLGPSGSGKTTLLRVLAGLETPDQGEIRFDGGDFLALPARKRRVGMVFQHYALFRHMTVAQNIAFGLTVRPRAERPSAKAIRERVGDLLNLVQLPGLEKRYPAQLSGGQRQRVALARALAIEPRLLLLDEPFGALDAKVRRDLRQWLRELHDRAGVTTVFVTHDQDEALDMADRVAILKDGRLVQLGRPDEVYDNPADPQVFDFLGSACRFEGTVEGPQLAVAGWRTTAPATAPQGQVLVMFRPDEVAIAPADQPGIAGQVESVSARGQDIRANVRLTSGVVELKVRAETLSFALAPGLPVRVQPLRPQLYPA